ncbi:integrase catalytic domain-containing protein [Trichonephila clavipes]|uniref:Integrase catalytic domain-containing protein n=1 Tax=Trichonephila clavipes TaxID=2585209 RepID=A0A8X6V384_TRICX|nr:integrase catalytic domain-containing protein [Trichonephila clavipes]
MNEYLALGHMREISQKRDDETPNCYIPYHMVINEKSTTTKCRVVFNASYKTKNGKSLNDVLMTGPKLQTEIFNHLIKFRSYRVAFAADIEKMYRQILISDEDCKYQRIVWRATPSDSLKSFELQTITYGTSCTPFLSSRTLQQLYQDEEQNFPLAAKIARENIYIDDLLSGADTEVEAKSIIIEIQNLLKSGGFILRKWSSSHPKVLQDLDTSLLASKPIHSLGDEESKQRVLGLIWNLKTDSIQVKVVHEEIVKTKRQLLSVIAQIFDPLGLFSPSVITLKIMLQELWKSKAFWDDPIPSSILENWNKFTKESKYLNSISIPRFMGIDQNSDIILHGFCDAFSKAYAAVVYLKSKQEIHLVSAKTRVAPIKQLTIPRLELCGALLLAELISVIQKALRTKPAECFLWTDSTIVLSWLMKPPLKKHFRKK